MPTTSPPATETGKHDTQAPTTGMTSTPTTRHHKKGRRTTSAKA